MQKEEPVRHNKHYYCRRQMLHGEWQTNAGEDTQTSLLSAEQQKIEQEATGTLDGITALMGGESEILKIIFNI